MSDLNKKDLGLMTVLQYAKHRGVHNKAVYEAVQKERISSLQMHGQVYIDPKVADKEWDENVGEMAGNGPKEMKNTEGPSYNQSRAFKQAYEARLAKLEYERRKGELILKAKVEEEAFNIARQMRNAFSQMPDRIAPELFSCDTVFEVTQVLRKELDQILEQLSKYE